MTNRSEQELLSLSDGWVNLHGVIGYFSFEVSRELVTRFGYAYHAVCFKGYLLRKLDGVKVGEDGARKAIIAFPEEVPVDEVATYSKESNQSHFRGGR